MYNYRNITEEIFNTAKKLIHTSPFYKNIYSSLDISDFSDLPIINKTDLLDDQKNIPPFGTNLVVNKNEISRIQRTSGTSNRPLMLALTQNDVNIISETGAKAFRTAGMNSNDIVINCMNYCMWMGGAMDHLSIEKTGAGVIPYGVGNTENLIQLMLDLDGCCIHATPSYLYMIEKVAYEKFHISARELHIKKGFFGGESGLQDKEFREHIENTWDMCALDANYGMSEAMSIMGAECIFKNGLHFTASSVLYPELRMLEEETTSYKNIKEGNIGELVVTNLQKESQPLIRYGTGDIIEILSTEKCKCGNDNFRFRVVSRKDNMIVVKGINFYPESIRDLISQHEECTGNYKILIPKSELIDRVNLLVELKTNTKRTDSLKLELTKQIRSKYFVTCHIEFTDYIPSKGNKQNLVEKISM